MEPAQPVYLFGIANWKCVAEQCVCVSHFLMFLINS